MKKPFTSLFMAIALFVSAGCTTENGDGNESSHVANQQVSLSFYQVTMQSLENSQAKTRADESSTSTALKNSPFTYLDISLIPTNGTGKAIVFRQVKAEINKQVMNDLNTEYVEVSAHVGARPNHQVWQGRIYHWKK